MNGTNPTFFLLRAPDSYQGCFVVSRLLINSFITSSMPVILLSCLKNRPQRALNNSNPMGGT